VRLQGDQHRHEYDCVPESNRKDTKSLLDEPGIGLQEYDGNEAKERKNAKYEIEGCVFSPSMKAPACQQ